MSYSPKLESALTRTHLRDSKHISPLSGMCAVCHGDCAGLCDIGYSAVRGMQAVDPVGADTRQFASEKEYPVDFSHFNINGRTFGAWGAPEDSEVATVAAVDLSSSFGALHPVKLDIPLILPAMAKIDWQDYFSGAALAGVAVVIGESVIAKDKATQLEKGKVVSSPLMADMFSYFRRYDRGAGIIILQANMDDEHLHSLDYAITALGATAVELKFGQAAKGIPSVNNIYNIEDAVQWKKRGYLISPDPENSEVIERYRRGACPVFLKMGRLPMYSDEALISRVRELRNLGAQQVCFKMSGFDMADCERVLRIASEAGVDLVTFDGAGGGTGHSPVRMMDEWGLPTVCLENVVCEIMKRISLEGRKLPALAVAGGLTLEDHVFKALAFGAPYVKLAGICRASLAAALTGQRIGRQIVEGKVPEDLKKYGTTAQEIFFGYGGLRALYGSEADKIPTGTVGVYSYLTRVAYGLKQLMLQSRKFKPKYLDQTDLIALTRDARELKQGLWTY